MHLLMIPWFLAACEPMSPSADPLAPVQIAATAVAAPIAHSASEDEANLATEDEEVFEISSEALHEAAEKVREGATSQEAMAEVSGEPGEATEDAQTSEEATKEDAPIEASNLPPGGTAAPSTDGTGWPVRLVVAMPHTQPPRAVIGLPDGQETVVRAGDMVPALGLVVMSIGKDEVQLAQVSAVGDHAEISSVTLSAQY